MQSLTENKMFGGIEILLPSLTIARIMPGAMAQLLRQEIKGFSNYWIGEVMKLGKLG